MPGEKKKERQKWRTAPSLSLLPFGNSRWSAQRLCRREILHAFEVSKLSGEQQRKTFAIIFLNHLLSCAKHFKTASCDKSGKYQGAPSLSGHLEFFPGSIQAQCCHWADIRLPQLTHPKYSLQRMTLLLASQINPGKYLSTKHLALFLLIWQ